MWDKILTGLTIVLLVIAGALIVSSGVNRLYDLGQVLPLRVIQYYGGFVLIGCSVLILLLNIVLTRHPLFEYWILAVTGFVVGSIYMI